MAEQLAAGVLQREQKTSSNKKVDRDRSTECPGFETRLACESHDSTTDSCSEEPLGLPAG